MRGDRKPLPLTARTPDELKVLSAALHDWWIKEADSQLGNQELALHLEAEGVACGPDDDWQTSRLSRSGSQQWEAPPSTYGAELIFKGVINVSVQDSARAGNYTIVEIVDREGTLVVRAEPELTLTLQVSAIDITARDRD